MAGNPPCQRQISMCLNSTLSLKAFPKHSRTFPERSRRELISSLICIILLLVLACNKSPIERVDKQNEMSLTYFFATNMLKIWYGDEYHQKGLKQLVVLFG